MSSLASRYRPRRLAVAAARLRYWVGRPVWLVVVGMALLLCGAPLAVPALSSTDQPTASTPAARTLVSSPSTVVARMSAPTTRPPVRAATPTPPPVAAMAAPAAVSATATATVRLHHGDTLWALAHRYATTVAALRALNHLGGSTRIYADTDFHVPAGSAGSSPAPEPATSTAVATHPARTPSHGNRPTPTTHPVPSAVPATGSVQQAAAGVFGPQYGCAAEIIARESGWNPHATNPSSGAYGLAQALPGSKMAAAGPDWATNPATQLAWMRDYVTTRYGGACAAWGFWQAHHWY